VSALLEQDYRTATVKAERKVTVNFDLKARSVGDAGDRRANFTWRSSGRWL
jgi:hypothetical protein